jgi:hypothetical protein
MSADLWMGLAIGLAAPWLLFLFFSGKPQQKRNLEDANELLRERNRIGAEMLDVQWELWRKTPPRREQIARLALQGYLAGRMHDDREMKPGAAHHKYIAESCLRYTDALITALDGKEGM